MTGRLKYIKISKTSQLLSDKLQTLESLDQKNHCGSKTLEISVSRFDKFNFH